MQLLYPRAVIIVPPLSLSLSLSLSQDETDEQYLRKVADVMHSLFSTHGSTLLPFFDRLLPTFAGMLVSFHDQ